MPSSVHSEDEPVTAIIVGAGFAGISAAIECTQRGLKVKVYESAKQLTAVGTLVSALFSSGERERDGGIC